MLTDLDRGLATSAVILSVHLIPRITSITSMVITETTRLIISQQHTRVVTVLITTPASLDPIVDDGGQMRRRPRLQSVSQVEHFRTRRARGCPLLVSVIASRFPNELDVRGPRDAGATSGLISETSNERETNVLLNFTSRVSHMERSASYSVGGRPAA